MKGDGEQLSWGERGTALMLVWCLAWGVIGFVGLIVFGLSYIVNGL